MEPPVLQRTREVHLFGGIRIQDEGGTRTLAGEKSQSLFAYLCLHPGVSHGRERLVDFLFPDTPFDRVRRNFSDTLYRLQKTLGSDWLNIEGEMIALSVDDFLTIDVWEFDRLTESDDPDDWQNAIDLYKGDLLPDCYDDWVLPERELRRNQFLFALENLASHQEAKGELQQALLTTRRLIITESLHEPAHQVYLRLLGRLQRYGEAQAHYDYLCQLLERELDAEPLAETQRILHALERERAVAAAPLPTQEQMPFVGRAAERAAILEAVENSLQGKGCILAIEGEAGIGKSRLLREISASARWRGATVLQGTAGEIPEASPFAPLADALSPFLHAYTAQLETLMSPHTLAALAPLFSPWQKYASQHPPASDQANRLFEHALRTLGETLTRLHPLVLILDDLQWASTTLWECLNALVPALEQNGALIILAYRRSEVEQTAGWDRLQTWDRNASMKIFPLQPLTPEEVGVLLDDKNGDDAALVHALTGGNLFLLGEWVDAPQRDETTRENLVAQRFSMISPAARAVLESASVLGETVPFQILAKMIDLPPLALAARSDELVTQRWLMPSASGFAFTHDLIRTAIYNEILPARRRELHTRAARAYQSLDADNARSFSFHLDRAGLAEDAASAYRRAGKQNRAWYAFREAQTALERALELMPPEISVARVETTLELADVCETTGSREVQQSALREALEGARQLRSEPLLLQGCLFQGRAFSTMNQFSSAEDHLKQAVTLARRTQSRFQEGRALSMLGLNANRQFQTEKAKKYYKQALKLARKISAPTLEGQCLSGLGISAVDAGAPQEAVKWLQQALAVQRANGDFLGEYRTQMYLATAYYHLGAWDRVSEMIEVVLVQYERMGNRQMLAYLRQLRGLAFYSLGDTHNAHNLLSQAEQDYQAVGDQQAAGLALNVLGLVAEDEGQFEKALDLYQSALATAALVEAINETALAKIDLGTLLVRLEQPAEAIPHLESAHVICHEHHFKVMGAKSEAVLGLAYYQIGDKRAEQLAESGWKRFQAGVPMGEQPQGWLWALSRLLSHMERHSQAEEVLRAAYQELQRQAKAIGNLDLRGSFFKRVPLNREIVAAYDRQTGNLRVLSVSLAHRDAPIGRPLHRDEVVTVQWTIHAPEEETIANKTELRHYRLKRLLQEAESQGAVPTDDDLANALGVSRRTILRDIQTLSGKFSLPPTRGRKNVD